MIAKTTLDVLDTRVHTRMYDEERATWIRSLGIAVPPFETTKVGASYALVRLYFAFARSAAHGVIGVIDCYFSYLRSREDATRR